MKKYILGGLIALLVNYSIGATYLLAKGVEKNVRTNRTNARSTR